MDARFRDLFERVERLNQALQALKAGRAAPDGARIGVESLDPIASADSYENLLALEEQLHDAIDALYELRSTRSDSEALALPSTEDSQARLAVLIGHSTTDPGATGNAPPFPVGMNTEFKWNSDLARRIQEFADRAGVTCRVFHRDHETIVSAYQRIRNWGASATVELHFNSADSFAEYSMTVYGHDDSRAWAQGMQDMMVSVFNRPLAQRNKLAIPGVTGGYNRGHANVTQIHPSALLEPFFGSTSSEVRLAEASKQAYAEGIVRAFAKFFGIQLSQPEPPPKPIPIPDPDSTVPDVALFKTLINLTESFMPSVPGLSPSVVKSLRPMILAQFAEESGWGRSDLAQQYFNFAGMKAIAEVNDVIAGAPATRVWYDAHDGPEHYLRFRKPFNVANPVPPDPDEPLSAEGIEDLRAFLRGYFIFLERSPYVGWKAHAQQSPEDFIRFIGIKWAGRGYADRVIALERRVSAYLEAQGDTGPTPSPLPAGTINMDAIPADATLFRQVVGFLPNSLREELRPHAAAVAAQWAIESGFGSSALAKSHFNFAGIEWPSGLEEISIRQIHPTNPAKGDYCRFFSPEDFVKGYSLRFTKDPALAGWENHIGDTTSFVRFLASKWRLQDPGYFEKVMARFTELSETAAGPTPGPGPAPSGGFVIRVKRLREERRGSDRRTVGTYEAFFNGQKLPQLEGHTVETRGLGDNSEAENGRRISAGTYDLFTHSSLRDNGVIKYRTFDYTDDATLLATPRPAVKLLPTGQRGGILFHPAGGFKMTVGCINLTRPLNNASSDMNWSDSRQRVIDMIDAMEERIANFPDEFHKRIPDATIVVEGEPLLDQRIAPAMVSRAQRETELDGVVSALQQELERSRTEAAAEAEPDGTYYVLAEALTAGADIGRVEKGLFDQVVASGVSLQAVRSGEEETLWVPWIAAWRTAAALTDPIDKTRATEALEAIAQLLLDQGVDVNDDKAFVTPLIAAASANAVSAMEKLVAFGAAIDAFAPKSGLNPLLAAAFFGSHAGARFLLSRQAKSDVTTRSPEQSALLDQHSELPSEGLSPLEAAEQGMELVRGNADMQARFDPLISTLWYLKNADALGVDRR